MTEAKTTMPEESLSNQERIRVLEEESARKKRERIDSVQRGVGMDQEIAELELKIEKPSVPGVQSTEPEPVPEIQPAAAKPAFPKQVPTAVARAPAPTESTEPESGAKSVEPSEKKDIEEGESVALLRDSNPSMYEKFIATEEWKQGDAQSREVLAGKLLEMGALLQKQRPEKPEKQDYVKRLVEKFPRIYKKLEDAKGWDRLHPDTQSYVARGFLEILKGDPWWERSIERGHKNIVFDIRASDSELRHPDEIRTGSHGFRVRKDFSSGFDVEADARVDQKGNIIIPIVYWKDASPASDNVHAAYETLLRLIPKEYSPEWVAGRLDELQAKYSGVYEKLNTAEHWEGLSQEVKDMLADAFIMFLQQYPERLSLIGDDSPHFSIELTKEARKSLKAGEPVLLGHLTHILSEPGETLVIEPAIEVLSARSILKEGAYKEYVKHVVGALRGIR